MMKRLSIATTFSLSAALLAGCPSTDEAGEEPETEEGEQTEGSADEPTDETPDEGEETTEDGDETAEEEAEEASGGTACTDPFTPTASCGEDRPSLVQAADRCATLAAELWTEHQERHTVIGIDAGSEERFMGRIDDITAACPEFTDEFWTCLDATGDRLTGLAACELNDDRDETIRYGASIDTFAINREDLTEEEAALRLADLVGTWQHETRHGMETWTIAADGTATVNGFSFQGEPEVEETTLSFRREGQIGYLINTTTQNYSFVQDQDRFFFFRNISSPPTLGTPDARFVAKTTSYVIVHDPAAEPMCRVFRSSGVEADASCEWGTHEGSVALLVEVNVPARIDSSIGGMSQETVVLEQVGGYVVAVEELDEFTRVTE